YSAGPRRQGWRPLCYPLSIPRTLFQEAVVRKTYFLAAVLVVVAFTSVAFGLDLTGKWIGTSPDGYPLVLTLKGEAAQVSGTMLSADGKTEYPIKDANVDGDEIG